MWQNMERLFGLDGRNFFESEEKIFGTVVRVRSRRLLTTF